MHKDYKSESLKNILMKKYLTDGLDTMSETEILQLILSFSEKKNINETTSKLLERYGSINHISRLDPKTLIKDDLLNNRSAVLLKIIAVISRLYNIDKNNIRKIDNVETAVDFLKSYYIGIPKEKITVIALENNFDIKEDCFVSSGTLEDVRISCHDIAKFTLNNNSAMIIIAHNHPLGTPEPSDTDLIATRFIIKTLENIGITLIDHIIIGETDSFSMREHFYNSMFKNVSDCGYRYNKYENGT